MNHTPGSWHLVDDGTIRSRIYTGDTMADYRGAIVCELNSSLGCEEWPEKQGQPLRSCREHALPEVKGNARLISAAPDFWNAACGRDPDMPRQIRPVSWLKSMVDECKRRGPAADDEDPSAFWDMVGEVEAMLVGLEGAIAKAEGR